MMKQKKQKCRRKRVSEDDWAEDSFKLAKTALGISVASKIIKDL